MCGKSRSAELQPKRVIGASGKATRVSHELVLHLRSVFFEMENRSVMSKDKEGK
jgi:hypothetical protein